MQHSSTPWWMTENYRLPDPVPPVLEQYAGPRGIAMVRAWPDGSTDKGWGGEQFIANYTKGAFDSRRALFGYNRGQWAVAFVMRSLSLVVFDIDGKNGGIEHAKRLLLPPTLAETSKSGNGYHLFYQVDQPWDLKSGFAQLSDRIGLEQGVDFRATGCVYHHPQQLWNDRPVAPLPLHLQELLTAREQRITHTQSRITSVLHSNDDMEVLMLQDEIEGRLMQPIPQGKRNNTLFAIGSEMKQAQILNWEEKLYDRAVALGLSDDESTKLVTNVRKYATVSTP